MFKKAAHARREIARTFESLSIVPGPETKRAIRLSVKRDLQAQKLRPNVPVPPRRKLFAYLRTMHLETGSWYRALTSLLHSGSWTSSGGSFRLADLLGVSMIELTEEVLRQQGHLVFLEIGAGWAGFGNDTAAAKPQGLAALANHYSEHLAKSVTLHFTNVTRWHDPHCLPEGVREHPYITAATLVALEPRELSARSVDVIYSQAAAYFEPDQKRFLEGAAQLLKSEGILIYNYDEALNEAVAQAARTLNMAIEKRRHLGGMNGTIVAFRKMDVAGG
ncbi:hypothetical protein [Pelagibius sp.]|uniref:hypothetical protein n=1 Tax=Pelagibius sp. TaxID=1931238 RepID=UPI003BAF5EDB